ncbi:MAG TPA: ABC transporter ATP-binding protein [Syntrophobacteria bacterium]|nr:ABC transporter ATP-binding protein [Syntrophobacteria bacterium]
MLKAMDISHTFDPRSAPLRWALRCVTVAVEAGAAVLITGSSGSGKTTLARIMAGLERPTQGVVRLRSEDLYSRKQRPSPPSAHVAMAFQYPERQFFADTVWDELSWGLRAGMGWDEEPIRARLAKVAEELELPLEAVARRSPRQLSSGQQRKVALVSLLALEPQVLILDEPLTGLNAKERRRLATLLRRRLRQDRAMVVIAHELELFLPWATTVAVLAGGRLAFRGSPQDLVTTADPAVLAAVSLPPLMEISSSLKRHALSEGPVSNDVAVVLDQVRRAVEERGSR